MSTIANALSFVPRKEKSVQLLHESTKTLALSASLLRMVKSGISNKENADRAHNIMGIVLQSLQHQRDKPEEDDEEKSKGLSFKSILKSLLTFAGRRIVMGALTFIGRRLITYIVRPILTFAGRLAMAIARNVFRSLIFGVIRPIIGLVAAFIIGNPLTAAIIGGTLLTAGGLYWLYRKFWGKNDADHVPARLTRQVEPPQQDISTTTAPVEASPVYQPTIMESAKSAIQTPISAVSSLFKSEPKSQKFQGFGKDMDSHIKEASSRFGLPEDVLRGFIKMEGGWTGKMSPTGAIGAGQFIYGTWNALAAKAEGKAIGMVPITKQTFRTSDDPRHDKRINTLATALLAKENARLLQKANLPVTGENLYMLHNIGPGIIPVMLGQPASKATLLAMQQNGMLKGQTAEQFLVYQKGRFSTHYAAANENTSVVAESKPTMGTPVLKGAAKRTAVIAATAEESDLSVALSDKVNRQIVKGKGKTLLEVS